VSDLASRRLAEPSVARTDEAAARKRATGCRWCRKASYDPPPVR
jgi:hypothetical protein